jgi:hypothetical protein
MIRIYLSRLVSVYTSIAKPVKGATATPISVVSKIVCIITEFHWSAGMPFFFNFAPTDMEYVKGNITMKSKLAAPYLYMYSLT